jgi:hypothetical protein
VNYFVRYVIASSIVNLRRHNMNNAQTLAALKVRLEKGQRATDAIATKGRLAYRMGIERRNNPENTPTARTVWERGWDAAKNEFEAMLLRWKNL